MVKPIELLLVRRISERVSRCAAIQLSQLGCQFGGFRNRAVQCPATAAPTCMEGRSSFRSRSEGFHVRRKIVDGRPFRSTVVKCLPLSNKAKLSDENDSGRFPCAGLKGSVTGLIAVCSSASPQRDAITLSEQDCQLVGSLWGAPRLC